MTQPQTQSSKKNKTNSQEKASSSSSKKAASVLPVGRFCWLALRTPDLDKAKAFYGDVVGWQLSVQDMGGAPYSTFSGSGAPVCHAEPTKGPASFLSYVVVDDVQAAARRVKAAGGRPIGEAHAIPGVGSMLEVQDGDGAAFSLFQPDSVEAAEVSRAPGGLLWNELWATDVPNALAFLTAVSGYVVAAMPMGGEPYHLLKHGEEMQAGVIGSPDPSSPSAWVPYFHVVDVDAARGRALAAGATALGEIVDVPTVGRMAVLLDPQGARFAIMTPPR